ncbi:MAG: glycosyltransferase family 9 protein [Candidatus Hermodarchaeia archaeon]
MRILYLLSHLQRGGGHGIVDFIVQSHSDIHFFNDCTPKSLKGLGQSKGIKKGRRVHALVSFENIPPSRIGNPPILKRFEYDVLLKILLLRDPFNWWASSQADPKARKKRKVARWKQFAVEFMNPGDWIPVSFNRWFQDDEYRKELANKLHLKHSHLPNAQRLCKAGPGSSFQKRAKPKDLNLLNRWRRYEDKPAFREFCKDPEITTLSKHIFNYTVDLPPLESGKLFAGPFVGEFGWELFAWQAWLRKHVRQHDYKEVVVATRPERFFFYEDFATHFVSVVPRGGQACMCHYNGGRVPKIQAFRGYRKIAPSERRSDKHSGRFIKWGQKKPECAYDLLLHCRSRTHRPDSNWAIKKWEALVAQFRSFRIAAIGTLGAAFCPAGVVDLRGIPLKDLVDVMASSDLLVGPSSGPMHLGSLCGIPHLVWSGESRNKPRYEKRWNPLRTRVYYYGKEGWQPKVESIAGKIVEIKRPPTNRIKFV